MRRPLIAIVGIALLGPAEALAEAGWYGSVTGAAAFLSDADLEEAGVAGEATFDTGLGVTGALGQTWPGLLRLGKLRTELEVGYSLNDIDTISAGGVTVSAGDADVSALSGMANVAFDLATGTVRPYALAGVGVAHLSLDSDDLGIDETDTVLATRQASGSGSTSPLP